MLFSKTLIFSLTTWLIVIVDFPALPVFTLPVRFGQLSLQANCHILLCQKYPKIVCQKRLQMLPESSYFTVSLYFSSILSHWTLAVDSITIQYQCTALVNFWNVLYYWTVSVHSKLVVGGEHSLKISAPSFLQFWSEGILKKLRKRITDSLTE